MYYSISCYWYRVQHIHVLLNKVGLRAQKFHQYNKNVIECCILMFILLISLYIPCDQQSTPTRVNIKTVLSYKVFLWFFTFKFIYLKYLKYLQSGQTFEPRISNSMWPHIFRSYFGEWFITFIVAYLAYFFYLFYVANIHLLHRWQGIGI